MKLRAIVVQQLQNDFRAITQKKTNNMNVRIKRKKNQEN